MEQNAREKYTQEVHRLGRTFNFIMILALIAVPVVMQIAFGYRINFKKTIAAVIAVLSYHGIVGAVEFISYTPILGSAGTYLTFITGNISNVKLPAAISAMKVADLEPGTEDAEVVSVIAIAISTFVTSGIVFIGMLLFGFLMPVLEAPVLAPAFANVMPAMLGGLALPFLLSELRTSSVPILCAAVLTLAIGYTTVSYIQSYLTPIFLVIAVVWRYVLYRRDNKKKVMEEKKDETIH